MPQVIDIYSASWGPTDDGKTVDGPRELTLQAMADGVNKVRAHRTCCAEGFMVTYQEASGVKHIENYEQDLLSLGFGNFLSTLCGWWFRHAGRFC